MIAAGTGGYSTGYSKYFCHSLQLIAKIIPDDLRGTGLDEPVNHRTDSTALLKPSKSYRFL